MTEPDHDPLAALLAKALSDEIPATLRDKLSALRSSLSAVVTVGTWTPQPEHDAPTRDKARCVWGSERTLTATFERQPDGTHLTVAVTGTNETTATLRLELLGTPEVTLEATDSVYRLSVEAGEIFRFVLDDGALRFATDWVA